MLLLAGVSSLQGFISLAQLKASVQGSFPFCGGLSLATAEYLHSCALTILCGRNFMGQDKQTNMTVCSLSFWNALCISPVNSSGFIWKSWNSDKDAKFSREHRPPCCSESGRRRKQGSSFRWGVRGLGAVVPYKAKTQLYSLRHQDFCCVTSGFILQTFVTWHGISQKNSLLLQT